MPSVGPILRGARLQAGLTLEHISSQTCIPVKILHALEENQLAQITSAFFYKSFVRQFCQCVKLSYETVSDAVKDASTFYPEPFKPEQLPTVCQHAVVKTGKRAFNLRSLFAAGSAVAVLAVCSGLYSYSQGKAEISADVSGAVSSTKAWFGSFLPGQLDPPAKTSAGLGRAEANVPSAAAGGSDAESGFRVEVSAIEASWLSIVADGRQTFSGILEPAERKVVEGRDNGRVRTGNAGGLKVVFNGKPVGIVGPRGQVRIVVFTKNNYEVLEPARTETAVAKFPDRITLLPASFRY